MEKRESVIILAVVSLVLLAGVFYFSSGSSPSQDAAPFVATEPAEGPAPSQDAAPSVSTEPAENPAHPQDVAPFVPTVPVEGPAASKLGDEAAILLQSYVNENLKPAYLAGQLTVKHRLIDTGATEGTDYTYGAVWAVNDGPAYAFLHYTPGLTATSDLGFWLQLNKVVSLDESTASAVISEYMQKSYTPKCETVANSIVVCEDFSQNGNVREGAGVLVSPSAGFTLVFSCRHFKEGELFDANSCMKRG